MGLQYNDDYWEVTWSIPHCKQLSAGTWKRPHLVEDCHISASCGTTI